MNVSMMMATAFCKQHQQVKLMQKVKSNRGESKGDKTHSANGHARDAALRTPPRNEIQRARQPCEGEAQRHAPRERLREAVPVGCARQGPFQDEVVRERLRPARRRGCCCGGGDGGIAVLERGRLAAPRSRRHHGLQLKLRRGRLPRGSGDDGGGGGIIGGAWLAWPAGVGLEHGPRHFLLGPRGRLLVVGSAGCVRFMNGLKRRVDAFSGRQEG